MQRSETPVFYVTRTFILSYNYVCTCWRFVIWKPSSDSLGHNTNNALMKPLRRNRIHLHKLVSWKYIHWQVKNHINFLKSLFRNPSRLLWLFIVLFIKMHKRRFTIFSKCSITPVIQNNWDARHTDMQKIRTAGLVFENRLHWQFKVEK
jgi:hypothetical protein